MRTLILLLSFLIATTAGAQSLTEWKDKPAAAQFNFKFSNAEWRSQNGHPRIFASDKGNETHFFAYGYASENVKQKTVKTEDGPYAEMNDWVNYMMMFKSSQAKDYITISKGKGLLVWMWTSGFTSHEKQFDTRVYFHLLVYAPNFPDTEDAEVYYLEDYRSDGIAEVFSARGDKITELKLDGDRLLFDASLAYDSKFGGFEGKISLNISGVIQIDAGK